MVEMCCFWGHIDCLLTHYPWRRVPHFGIPKSILKQCESLTMKCHNKCYVSASSKIVFVWHILMTKAHDFPRQKNAIFWDRLLLILQCDQNLSSKWRSTCIWCKIYTNNVNQMLIILLSVVVNWHIAHLAPQQTAKCILSKLETC